MASLYQIGVSGLQASTRLLQTASNNVSNVNTPGFIRERTVLSSQVNGGVGLARTERVVNEFAQRQVIRNTSSKSFFEQFSSEAQRVDTLFSNQANSIAVGLDTYFQRLQTAVDTPTSITSRQLVIGEGENLLTKFNTLSNLVLDQASTVNQQLQIHTSEVNNLIQNVAQLNKDIFSASGSSTAEQPNALLTQRDESLRKLSELISINTIDAANGDKLVFLDSGESLILEQGDFNLISISGNPDPNRLDLQLQLSANNNLNVPIDAEKIGGQIGGLLSFREQVLEPTQRNLSQIAIALTDSMNSQNRLGMDADGQLGGDLFTLPTFGGLPLRANTGTGSMSVGFEAGASSDLVASDFLVTVNTGPDSFTIQALDDKGDVIAGTAVTQAIPAFPTTFDSTNVAGGNLYGLSLTINAGAANGDQFVLQPLKDAAHSITQATERAEDIALASPIRTESDLANTGSSSISQGVVTDTNPATSDFTLPGGLTTDPIFIEVIGAGDQFRIHDSDPRIGPTTVLGTTAVLPSGQFDNIVSAAGLNYGYDVDVDGVPAAGDIFTVSFNTGGFNDNRNGLELAGLQNQDTMKKSVLSPAGADNTLTFHEAYAGLVSQVGDETARANTNEQAFDALLEQATSWHESISGVNLDEEAANLIQFQQSYSAAARIISTAQSIFDTLLNSVR